MHVFWSLCSGFKVYLLFVGVPRLIAPIVHIFVLDSELSQICPYRCKHCFVIVIVIVIVTLSL